MANTRDTGYLRNLIAYDGSGNVILPANLTVTGSLLANGGGSYATQSYVTTQISNLVNGAPGALDTLNELAAALGNNASFSTTVTNSIATKLALSGGTLTGALSGTSATFSGTINLTGTANSFQVASIFRNANRLFFGGDTGGYFFQNSGNTTTILQIADSGAATFSSNVTASSFGGNSYPYNSIFGNGTDASYSNLYAGSTSGYVSAVTVNGGGAGTPNTISIYTASAERIRVTNGGDTLFQFAGNRRIGIDYNFAGDYFYGFATNSNARQTRVICAAADANAGISFETGGSFSTVTTKMIITSLGSIGIGTTLPSGKLHIYQSSVTDTYLESGTSGTSGRLIFKTSDNSDLNKYIAQESYYMVLSGNSNEGFKFRDSSNTILMSVYGTTNAYAGRVGIGTTTPAYNLSVASYLGVGAQGGGDIVLIGGGSGVGAFIQLRYATGTTNVHLAGNGNSYLNAYYGNTGVGTTNPASTLSVQGEIAKYCTTSGVDGNFQNLIKYGYSSDLQSGNSNANRWLGIDATVTAGAAVTNTLRIRAYGGGSGNAAPVNVVDFRGDQSSVFYSYIRHNTRVFSGNSYVGNLSPNFSTSYTRNYLLVCDLNNAAGFSLSGQMNAASYTCWNMSSFWIMKNYSSTNGSAGITGMYKGGGCDMNIVDLNYAGGRYIAIGYTSNPEVNGMWIGYRVNHMLNADGSAIVVPDSSVSINSTYATY